ncbi:hypothetical protein [Niabella ginsengisoli]|uniref:Uncharacterized protein n=1 Tax=Niabella ginsengisoli TaxID=522298 RepID=A0ABS9SIW3_9BACT|nr:hypothetical protein [Niabella ginsengisoli]MCH5598290.1 hypothetical protein [Niabella ginsengisoli]
MIIDKTGHIDFKEKLHKALRQQSELYSQKSIINCIKQLLSEHRSAVWYLINEDLLEQLSIDTTNRIYISGPQSFRTLNVKGCKVIFTLQRCDFSKDTIPYLQLLDVLLIFRKLSTVKLKEASVKYVEIIRHLSYEEKKLLTKLARKSTPFVRATLAILLYNAGDIKLYIKLAETINPVTFKKYRENLKELDY